MVYNKGESIPKLGDNDVLVKFRAAALNSRDASIPFVRLLFRHGLILEVLTLQ